jgi:hypothetical protein
MAKVRQFVPRSVIDRGARIAEPIYVPVTELTPSKGIGFDTHERVVNSMGTIQVARSAAGIPRSRRSNQEHRLTIPLVAGIQPVTNG